jgi:biopolymer transport protein ExbB/TolQ
MFSPTMIPLAVFLMVVLIVAISQIARLRDKEIQAQQQLHAAQLEHQRKMQGLQAEHERVKQTG